MQDTGWVVSYPRVNAVNCNVQDLYPVPFPALLDLNLSNPTSGDYTGQQAHSMERCSYSVEAILLCK